MPSKNRELGAQNPELKNSPIAWEGDEDIETLRGSLFDHRGNMQL